MSKQNTIWKEKTGQLGHLAGVLIDRGSGASRLIKIQYQRQLLALK